MKKSKLILASLLAVSIIPPVSSASATEVQPKLGLIQETFLHFTPVSLDTLTSDEQNFVETAKTNKPGIYQLGNLYVVTLGEKPNSGYNIAFEDSQTTFEKEQIRVKLSTPLPNHLYSEVITYPYIVGRLDLPSKYMSIEVVNIETGKSIFEESNTNTNNIFNAVAIDKEWTIRFNTPLKKETITNKNIYIYEKANGTPVSKFPVEVTLMNDGQSIKVKPKAKYKYGQQYTLFISKKVSSIKNIQMRKNKVVPFTTIKAPNAEIPSTDPSKVTTLRYMFENGTDEWTGNFSDYQEGMDIQAQFAHTALPKEIGENVHGLYISSSNRSDDVFMFIKKKLDGVDGIKPNTTYHVNLQFDLATNVGTDLDVGIGGSPGGSVFVKAGATTIEPKPILNSTQYYQTNIYYGNQSEGGIDAALLGDIFKNSESGLFELKPFVRDFEVTTDDKGELWLLIGTDSGYEGITSLYFTNIIVGLTEK